MFNLQRLREDFVRSRRGAAGRVPPAEHLRELCGTLLEDVTARQRDAFMLRLGRLRRADDVMDLRSALFDLVSCERGETVARERLATLDSAIAAIPRSAFGPPRNTWSATVS